MMMPLEVRGESFNIFGYYLKGLQGYVHLFVLVLTIIIIVVHFKTTLQLQAPHVWPLNQVFQGRLHKEVLQQDGESCAGEQAEIQSKPRETPDDTALLWGNALVDEDD
jgi:hypothetical protein